MHKQWFSCSPQNFQSGRSGFTVQAVVLHRTGGSLADIDTRCSQTGTFSSAHYAVGADGTVHQYVEEADTAFHAGVVVDPVWAHVQPGQNPNFYTIAIELAGNPGDPISGAQYDAAAELVAEITARCQIAMDSDHVALHSEIRSDRACPGEGFDRAELLKRAQAATAAVSNPPRFEQAVRILQNANVRESAPSTTARIVRVAPAGTTETAGGFTDQGERVQGNSYWYQTQDGNYFWAGSTDCPNPIAPKVPQPVPVGAAPLPSTASACGIPKIDQLFSGAGTVPITSADDARTIGAIQDLLTGLGIPGLPTVLSTSYGLFGPKTESAITTFRQQQGLDPSPNVDAAMLQKMVATPATDPRASAAYTALVLGFPQTGMQRILSLVSQMEGAGKFAAINKNTDRAGLSFGLIQWAQKPGRLTDILVAMMDADRDQFISIIGGGSADTAAALIAHCRKPSGGVDPKTGDTVNPSFDLVTEPWPSRFRQAALSPRFQQAQLRSALAAFNSSYNNLRKFAPDLVSERSVGFMLDVANQFGDGGVEKLYNAVRKPGMTETAILEAIADTSVERVADNLQAGVRARRDHFLQTPFLTNETFTPDEVLAAGTAK